jgi:hypothetical protein
MSVGVGIVIGVWISAGARFLSFSSSLQAALSSIRSGREGGNSPSIIARFENVLSFGCLRHDHGESAQTDLDLFLC